MQSFHYKKRYGQNFLKNQVILKKIASLPSYTKNSLVIEVGPGAGALTKYLHQFASQVLCYEIDSELEDILTNELKEINNVRVIFQDFLTRNLEEDLKEYSYDALYFVSNVPYYITTPILFKLLSSPFPFEEIVMLVQKEVGERICASVGKKAYGALTVLLNYYFHTKKCFVVGRNEFVPAPKVESVVISLKRREEVLFLKSEQIFQKLVHDSFQFKRKTIRNNLKNYPLEKLEPILLNHGYSLSSRAEQIPYEVFVELSNQL